MSLLCFFILYLLFYPQIVQQQLLSKTIADQAAVEGNNEEKEAAEERSHQLKHRYITWSSLSFCQGKFVCNMCYTVAALCFLVQGNSPFISDSSGVHLVVWLILVNTSYPSSLYIATS